MTNIDPIQLQNDLAQFHGTEEWHRWSPLFKNMTLTDGALYLAEKAQAFWLMDLIASHQSNPKLREEYMQVWKIKLLGDKALIICEDGNYNQLVQQAIEYTDFPFQEFTVWAIEGGPQNTRVIMLPSEY